MKRNLTLILLLLTATGCGLLWGPTSTVKKFMSAAQKGDADTELESSLNSSLPLVGRARRAGVGVGRHRTTA